MSGGPNNLRNLDQLKIAQSGAPPQASGMQWHDNVYGIAPLFKKCQLHFDFQFSLWDLLPIKG
jgi:hypothetical protein